LIGVHDDRLVSEVSGYRFAVLGQPDTAKRNWPANDNLIRIE